MFSGCRRWWNKQNKNRGLLLPFPYINFFTSPLRVLSSWWRFKLGKLKGWIGDCFSLCGRFKASFKVSVGHITQLVLCFRFSFQFMVFDVGSENQREFLCCFDWGLMRVSYGCYLGV